MYRHIQAHAHVARTETVCPSTDSLAPNSVRVRASTQFRAYANTVYRPYLLLLPLYLLLILIAVVDPTRELLSEWFLSVDLCGFGTDLFSFTFTLI